MIAIIGGTGLSRLFDTAPVSRRSCESRFGSPSDDLSVYEVADRQVVFLPRHGHPHRVAPHLINYRANLDCLQKFGVTKVIAVNAVGGIHPEMGPEGISIPDQIIDYTYGREHTIYDAQANALDHIDMSYPYSDSVRAALIDAARDCHEPVLANGCYAATQGPRLESSAEIKRIKRDGGDMVGMTGMPEAAIARELGMDYGCIALSVNWAAGIVDEVITMDDINASLSKGMDKALAIVKRAVALL